MVYSPISINIPIEIDAGSFDTAVTVQGETVTYNHVNIPLMYGTQNGDPTSGILGQCFLWKEDSTDQTQVVVDINPDPVSTYANGTAAVKALFKAALLGTQLRNLSLTSGVVYADDSARNTETDPVKYYVNRSVHTDGNFTSANLKAYLLQYLYENLSATIGLAATTGDMDITLSRDGVDAAEIIAEALTSQICGNSNTEQGVAAAALRQNIYEQMFTLAPDRFQDSSLMRMTTANDAVYKDMPFIKDDTISFLVTYKFPASQITAPVFQNAIRSNGNTFVSTGSKITVVSPADATTLTRPNMSDFPPCTVLLRTKITDTVEFTNSLPYTVNYLVNMGRADYNGGWTAISFANTATPLECVSPLDNSGADQDGDAIPQEQLATTDNMGDVTGKIVVIERGIVQFWQKVARAIKNGAAGVVIYNSTAIATSPQGDGVFNIAGPITSPTSFDVNGTIINFPQDFTIPVILVSNNMGQYLVTKIRSSDNDTVFATISGADAFATSATFSLGTRSA